MLLIWVGEEKESGWNWSVWNSSLDQIVDLLISGEGGINMTKQRASV